MFIMLGYRGEELVDLEATVDHLKKTSPDVFLTTVAYPIKGTQYYQEVEGDIVAPGEWEGHTDRDLRVKGRHSRRYYQFVRRWMINEVSRDRDWRHGAYLRAARAATKAGLARLGMVVTRHEREA
jgi:hypothetical protein